MTINKKKKQKKIQEVKDWMNRINLNPDGKEELKRLDKRYIKNSLRFGNNLLKTIDKFDKMNKPDLSKIPNCKEKEEYIALIEEISTELEIISKRTKQILEYCGIDI